MCVRLVSEVRNELMCVQVAWLTEAVPDGDGEVADVAGALGE